MPHFSNCLEIPQGAYRVFVKCFSFEEKTLIIQLTANNYEFFYSVLNFLIDLEQII